MAPAVSSKIRFRGMVLTAGVAAITMVGTFYGAGLKSEQEAKERRTSASASGSASGSALSTSSSSSPASSTPAEDEFIAALQTRRRALEQTKKAWEKKAAMLRERMEANSQLAAGRGSSHDKDNSGSAPER